MKTMTIGQRLAQVRSRIERAEQRAGRSPNSVCLVAVSKTQGPEALIAAYQNKQRHFGENYLQEAISKQQSLANYRITWHFIGPVQSNKTRIIANQFSWVHSVDRIRIASRLEQQRRPELGPLNICLQINIDSETSKSGISLEQLPELAAEVAGFRNLRLRGLMAIPAAGESPEPAEVAFRKMREAFASLRGNGYRIDTLSMGMSDDLESAIEEGSTLVRIGTSIFGPRQ
ncbi:MAG: YggS family pyridoxal phosphate-dependent enzyme [Methylococcales bacterium]